MPSGLAPVRGTAGERRRNESDPAPLESQQISFSAYSALPVETQAAPVTLTAQELAVPVPAGIPCNLGAWEGNLVIA